MYLVGGRFVVKGGFQPERLAQGMELVSIRRIQGFGYGVLEFLGIRHIDLLSSVVFGECRHRFAVSSLTDTAYWLESKHDVYSTKRILVVINVKVKERYGYGHLEEIEVRRSDQQLFKFMEGDFPRLYLHDIEDMFITYVHKTYRDQEENGRPLTWCRKLPEEAQHLYTNDTQGRNKPMCSHELYKFSGGALISLRDTLKDMANNLEMGYTSVMPRRRWSSFDKKRFRIMIKDIDRQLLDRRLIRSLEKFVGGREYGEDLRLLQRTI
ncbi:hypothetical protein Tco_1517443 [Tanacetum coccineum]